MVSTNNPHKLTELRTLLAGLEFELTTASDLGVGEVEETGTTFLDNALLKAVAAYERCGLACLADDSGLEVDALDGAPGVYSARFAGEDATYADNNRRLLAELDGVAVDRRGARFVCTIALLVPSALAVAQPPPDAAWSRVERDDVPEGAVLYAIEGQVRGRITRAARGDAGFGYDPLFLYEPEGRTFAELSAAEKNRISHRAAALHGLRDCLSAVNEAGI